MKIQFYIALAVTSAVAVAQSAPPTDESIKQMLTVMHVEKMLDQMFLQMDAAMKSGMEQGLQQSLHGQELNAAQKAAIEKFKEKLSATMKDELSFAKMQDIYLQAYRDTFTQEDVTSITAFYNSPIGKTVVEKIPIAMQKAGTLMQARITPMVQKMQTMQEEFVKELSQTK
ncbi:MAG TPA: DUF2059 domain-containing protein [Chthoniobacterales bacterium]|jgi:hypothetical protein|nr:DUF2059 domain-containing protein [Chthoniobacterales bacterium]